MGRRRPVVPLRPPRRHPGPGPVESVGDQKSCSETRAEGLEPPTLGSEVRNRGAVVASICPVDISNAVETISNNPNTTRNHLSLVTMKVTMTVGRASRCSCHSVLIGGGAPEYPLVSIRSGSVRGTDLDFAITSIGGRWTAITACDVGPQSLAEPRSLPPRQAETRRASYLGRSWGVACQSA
jgi:hypothetical protein